MASFDDRKRSVLQSLASDAKDKSRAGSVDAPIATLIARINHHPLFFTTSSCSGRISVFSEGKRSSKKKGGDWVYVSHEPAVESQVVERLQEYCSTTEEGLLVFRFEPFILALECRTPAAAQLLVTCALSAGFRESGIAGMGKRNIVGVRCSIRLEVPIAQSGHMLVTEQYMQFLTALANEKMELNRQRTDMFLTKFVEQVEGCNVQKLSELGKYMQIYEPSSGLPLESLANGSLEDKILASVRQDSCVPNSQKAAENRFKQDKECKKKISALKGRQLRVLSRLNVLEDGLLLSAGVSSEKEARSNALVSQGVGDVCSNIRLIKPFLQQGRKKTRVFANAIVTVSKQDNGGFDNLSLRCQTSLQETQSVFSAFNGTHGLLSADSVPFRCSEASLAL